MFYLGILISLIGSDNSEIASVALRFGDYIKIQFETTTLPSGLKLGDKFDIFISCNASSFQVSYFLRTIVPKNM